MTPLEQLLYQAARGGAPKELQRTLASRSIKIRRGWALMEPHPDIIAERYEVENDKVTLYYLSKHMTFEQAKKLAERGHGDTVLEAAGKRWLKGMGPGEKHEKTGLHEIIETIIKTHGHSAKQILSNASGLLSWVTASGSRSETIEVLLRHSNPNMLHGLIAISGPEHLETITKRLLGLDYENEQHLKCLETLLQTLPAGNPDTPLAKLEKKLPPELGSILRWWVDPRQEPGVTNAYPWFALRKKNTSSTAVDTSSEEALLGVLETHPEEIEEIHAWIKKQTSIRTDTGAKILTAMVEFIGIDINDNKGSRRASKMRWISKPIEDTLAKMDRAAFTRAYPELAQTCLKELLESPVDLETLKPLKYSELVDSYGMARKRVAAVVAQEILRLDQEETFNALAPSYQGTLEDLLEAVKELGQDPSK